MSIVEVGVKNMAERRVRVATEVGIQARPATIFVDAAAKSGADVSIAKSGGAAHDAKSILQVLNLDIRSGDEIVIASDDEAILDRLVELVTGDSDPAGEAEIADTGDVDDED